MITQIPNCMNGARTLKIHQDFIVPLQLLVTSEVAWEERITREDSWLHSAGWLIRVIKRTRRGRDNDDDDDDTVIIMHC